MIIAIDGVPISKSEPIQNCRGGMFEEEYRKMSTPQERLYVWTQRIRPYEYAYSPFMMLTRRIGRP
jgi:hypothetical protein